MADTIDPRFGQPLWADDNSTFPGVAGWTAIFQAIYGKSAIGRHGLTSAMGSPSVPDVFYWATDTKRLWSSGDGSGWTEVSPVGGGGTPIGHPVSGTAFLGNEGTSRIAARADHNHPQPAWPIALYEFERQSPNTYDSFTPGHMAAVIAGSFTGPAGLYLFGATAVVSTQSAATDAYTVGYLRYTVNGVNLTEDSRCDMTRVAQSVSFTKAKAVGAGTVTLTLYLQTSSANGSIYTNGSHIWAAYLGPN